MQHKSQLSVNPLSGLMRKPKLKITLPSQGKYWPEKSIIQSPDNTYEVYSMTAKDEMNLKNPTAVTNGDAFVEVIQSCIPAIKNAWHTPNIDIDLILISIRIASYGTDLNTKVEFNGVFYPCIIDLSVVKDQIETMKKWEEEFKLNDEITLYLNPVPYKILAKTTQETVETQKIMDIINDDTASEEKKLNTFKKSFAKLTEMTMSFVQYSVYKILYNDQEVVDRAFINEFIEKCDTEVFSLIKDRIDQNAIDRGIKPIKINASEEMRLAGSDDVIEIPFVFDVESFFKEGMK